MKMKKLVIITKNFNSWSRPGPRWRQARGRAPPPTTAPASLSPRSAEIQPTSQTEGSLFVSVFIIKEPPKQPCNVVFHHEYVGLLHYWLDLPRPVTLIHQKVHGLRRVLGVKKAPKLLAPSLRYELLKVASKYVTLPLTLWILETSLISQV